MRAARSYDGEERFRIENVGIPAPGAEDVLVKVEAAGVTRGLLSLWKRRRRIELLPAVLGYEMAGVVTEVGAAVSGVLVGDRVRVHPVLSCRNCRFCRNDADPLCPAVSVQGGAIYGPAAMPLYRRYHNGGLAEYVKAPGWNLDPLPGEVGFDEGARAHSLGIALRALRHTENQLGDTLVVTAATGGVGASAVKLAPLLGFTRVIAVSRTRENLERVRALEPDLVEVVATDELTDGWRDDGGLTAALRAVGGGEAPDALADFMPGDPAVTLQALLALRKGGKAVLAGGHYEELRVPYGTLMHNSYQVRGSNGYTRTDGREVLALLSTGRLDVSQLVTHTFPLAETNQAMETVESRVGGSRFVVVHPGD